MSLNIGDGYIACQGDGFNRFRFSPDKENSEYSSISINRINRNSKWTELAGDDGQRSYFSLSPKSRGSPQFGDEYSLFRSRSTSLSSTGSVRSTGTMCESESSEQGRSLRSTEPPSRVLSPLQCTRNLRVPDNCDEIKKWKVEVNLATAAELSSLSSIRTVHQPNPSTREQRRLRRKTTNDEPMPRQGSTNVRLVRKNSGRMGGLPVNADIEDDVQSVSTVSGSGIDFFRKFVQRKTSATEGVESCRECQDQFRREVLIDRLVSDSLSTRARLSVKSNKGGADSLPAVLEDRLSSDPGLHRCVLHQEDQEDSRSVSTKSSVSRVSSVSGTGLLFLKNYLKKKKSKSRSSTSHGTKDVSNMSFFNSTPLPFPPQGGFYGPAFVQEPSDDGGCHSRRHSLCSTVADLLNEDFDCDDSELKNLDWEEWDEPLPEDLTYDDLVSVISESFYSEELDFSELCDLDLEGRKTVVANDKEISSPSIVNSDNTVSPDDARRRSPNPAPEPEKALSSEPRSKYGSYKSNSFLLDLEAELELPPMTPVSDEKEEAVRAISRTISKYMRTRSDGSYEGGVTRSDGSYEGGATKSDGSYEGGVPSRQSYYSRTNTNRSYDGADPRTTYRLSGSMSRQSVCVSRQEDYGRVSRNSGYEGSRLSMVSPAKSDCIPELSAAEPSSRRPLSQLLIYDAATISPTGRLSPEEQRLHNYGNQSYPLLGGVRGPRSPPAPLIQQKISEILSLPKNEYSRSFEDKSGDMRQTDPSVLNYHETRLRNNDNKTKTANRDSLLCGASNNLSPTCSPPPAVVRPTFFRHSSTNSSDSGCPLFEDKVPSLSPTPSPRTNIELLSSNRTKLANFWERSLGTSQSSEVSTWVPGSSGRQGFQPVKSTFCSEASLGNSQDRLAHFLDVTRRAAEGRRNGRGYFHRASTGSDCSDFFERIPPSPSLNRRRDSFTEHFV